MDYFKEYTREALIEWLCLNDKHGVYTDEDSIAEFGEVADTEELREIATRQYYGLCE